MSSLFAVNFGTEHPRSTLIKWKEILMCLGVHFDLILISRCFTVNVIVGNEKRPTSFIHWRRRSWALILGGLDDEMLVRCCADY